MGSAYIAIAAWIIIATSAGGLTVLALANRFSPKALESANRK
jgi:hypothetical protein